MLTLRESAIKAVQEARASRTLPAETHQQARSSTGQAGGPAQGPSSAPGGASGRGPNEAGIHDTSSGAAGWSGPRSTFLWDNVLLVH